MSIANLHVYNILPKNPKSNIQIPGIKVIQEQICNTGTANWSQKSLQNGSLKTSALGPFGHNELTTSYYNMFFVAMLKGENVLLQSGDALKPCFSTCTARRFLRTDSPPLCSTFWMRQHCKTTKWLAQPHHGNWKGDAYPTLWKRKNSIFPTISRG